MYESTSPWYHFFPTAILDSGRSSPAIKRSVQIKIAVGQKRSPGWVDLELGRGRGDRQGAGPGFYVEFRGQGIQHFAAEPEVTQAALV